MQITSREIWETLEVSLIQLKNKNLDDILSTKVESLINHFNGAMIKNKQFETIDKIKVITSTVNNKNFFKTRNIDKEDVKFIKDICENLSLLSKVLLQESKTYVKEEDVIKKDRFPNINNDKSLGNSFSSSSLHLPIAVVPPIPLWKYSRPNLSITYCCHILLPVLLSP